MFRKMNDIVTMALKVNTLFILLTVCGSILNSCEAATLAGPETKSDIVALIDDSASVQRQFPLGTGAETSTPNFIRLVVMRLIYGIASSMGVEDRLEEAFNGAFVPPNADDSIDFGGFGGDDDSDGDGEGILDGVFDNDLL